MRRDRRAVVPPEMRSRDVEALDQLNAAVVASILARYARVFRTTGKPIYCNPGRAEATGAAPRRENHGSDGKLIYDTAEQAEACAAELTQVMGWPAQRAYPCGRSARGHHHLTVDVQRKGRR